MVDEIELLVGLSRAAHLAQNQEELLQALVEHCAQLLGVARVSAYLLDHSRSRLMAVARAGVPIHWAPVEYTLGEGLLGWIAEHQRPIRSADAESDPRFLPRQTMRSRLGSFVGVPMLAGAACVGVLSATQPEPDSFSEHHERLLVLAAGLCACELAAPRPT